MRYKAIKGAVKRRNPPSDQEKKRALGVLYNALLARDLLVGSRDGGQRLDVKTDIGRPAFSVEVSSIYKGVPTYKVRTPYSDSVITFDEGGAGALEQLIKEHESRGPQKNPRKSIHFAGRNYDIVDGQYVPTGYGGGYESPEPKRARSRKIVAGPSLLDAGRQAAKEAQMNSYSSALSYVDKAQAAIRGAQVTRDPSYLEQARYALKAAKWQGAILQKSPYAEAHDRALVRRKISEAAKALQDEELYMAKKNPASSRTKAKHSALLAAGHYEDAAKVWKRSRAAQKRKNPLTSGLGDTYAIMHANPPSDLKDLNISALAVYLQTIRGGEARVRQLMSEGLGRKAAMIRVIEALDKR